MKKMSQGFTLVELLIVIALIAILSVAVLATINPIEQTNKARDAKFKNDAAEVLSAYERYYASQNQYPWNSISFAHPIATGNKMVLDGRDSEGRFGILGSTGAVDGLLISTSELKASFGGKDPFKSTVTNVDKLYAYNNGSDGNYVCFCPKANANRTGAVADQLKCVSSATMGIGTEIKNIGTGCLKPTVTNSTTFCDPGTGIANVLCVPEGTIF